MPRRIENDVGITNNPPEDYEEGVSFVPVGTTVYPATPGNTVFIPIEWEYANAEDSENLEIENEFWRRMGHPIATEEHTVPEELLSIANKYKDTNINY